MVGNNGGMAIDLADMAANNAGEKRVEAIGEGLAAIAYAILDLAEAIRETRPLPDYQARG